MGVPTSRPCHKEDDQRVRAIRSSPPMRSTPRDRILRRVPQHHRVSLLRIPAFEWKRLPILFGTNLAACAVHLRPGRSGHQ